MIIDYGFDNEMAGQVYAGIWLPLLNLEGYNRFAFRVKGDNSGNLLLFFYLAGPDGSYRLSPPERDIVRLNFTGWRDYEIRFPLLVGEPKSPVRQLFIPINWSHFRSLQGLGEHRVEIKDIRFLDSEGITPPVRISTDATDWITWVDMPGIYERIALSNPVPWLPIGIGAITLATALAIALRKRK